MTPAVRRITTFLAAARRAGREPERCRICLRPPAEEATCPTCRAPVDVCAFCLKSRREDGIREALGALDATEALGWAQKVAIRDKEVELAAALQSVLLLHLTGGSLQSVIAMVKPEEKREAVN